MRATGRRAGIGWRRVGRRPTSAARFCEDPLMDVAPISAEPIMVRAGAGQGDYDVVRRAIEFISRRFRTQPSLDEIAAHVGLQPLALKRLFARWAGLTP